MQIMRSLYDIMIPCKVAPRSERPGCFRLAQGCRRGSLPSANRRAVHHERNVAEVGADEPLNRAPEIETFYTSWVWRKCRKAFAESKGNLCERCLKRGIVQPGSKKQPLEVHHKIPLTVDNVKDPDIALGWSNLELLCKSCHDEERERRAKRWKIGPDGRVRI